MEERILRDKKLLRVTRVRVHDVGDGRCLQRIVFICM